jgi:hypothetical protein
MAGIPCPICGSTNTYCTSFDLVCRAKGHRTPLNQLQGYDNSPQQQGPPPQGNSITDVYLNFGH